MLDAYKECFRNIVIFLQGLSGQFLLTFLFLEVCSPKLCFELFLFENHKYQAESSGFACFLVRARLRDQTHKEMSKFLFLPQEALFQMSWWQYLCSQMNEMEKNLIQSLDLDSLWEYLKFKQIENWVVCTHVLLWAHQQFRIQKSLWYSNGAYATHS